MCTVMYVIEETLLMTLESGLQAASFSIEV